MRAAARLVLFLSSTAAFAQEKEAATNPYFIRALDSTIALPGNMTVVKEEEQETSVVVTLALDGRRDCGYSISVAYSEEYEDYHMITLPQSAKQEMIDYYAHAYPSDTPPSIQEMDGDAVAFSPLIATGKGSDGHLYAIYVMVIKGFIITVSGATTAQEFDDQSYGALCDLFFQVVDMLDGGTE